MNMEMKERRTYGDGSFVILPVDRSAGNCLVKESTCAPLRTSVPLRDPPQEPAKKQSGAAAADRTPTPNAKNWFLKGLKGKPLKSSMRRKKRMTRSLRMASLQRGRG